MPTCGSCGATLDGDESFCPECGSAVEHAGSAVDEAGPDAWGASTPGAGAETAGGGREGAATEPAASEDADAGAAGGGGPSASEEPSEVGDGAPASADEEKPPTTVPDGPSPFERDGFSFGAGYATRDGWDPLVLGAVVVFAGWIVPIVGIFLYLPVVGYGFSCCRAAARGQPSPPSFDEFGRSIGDGLRLSAIVFVYGLGLLILGGGSALALGYVNDTAGSVAFLGWALVLGLGFPASATAYAAHESFGAAFSPSYAGAFAATGTYVKAYVVWLAAQMVIVVVGLLSVLTLVGPAVVYAWAQWFQGSVWGYYYRQAVERGEAPAAPGDLV